jgi:hypothetical protein
MPGHLLRGGEEILEFLVDDVVQIDHGDFVTATLADVLR